MLFLRALLAFLALPAVFDLDFNAGQEWTDSASAANRTRPEGSGNHETRYDLSDLYG